MTLHQPTPSNPRQRLSLFTSSTLGHDVSAALKASSMPSPRAATAAANADHASAAAIQETPAPPPSPVDLSYPAPAGQQHAARDRRGP